MLRFRTQGTVRGIDGATRAGLLYSFNDHSFADLHSVGDDVVRTHALAEGHASKGYFVVVPDNVNDVGALHLRNGFLRNQERVLGDRGCQPDTAKLSGS